MIKNKKVGMVRLLDKELKKASKIETPTNGWINSIRRILNMSMDQLGGMIGLTSQGIHALEKREKEGKITLKKLREVARAFDMVLVYALVPRTSLEQMIEEKSIEKAKEIVQRSNQNMKLEDQQVDDSSVKEQIEEISNELKNNISSILWQ